MKTIGLTGCFLAAAVACAAAEPVTPSNEGASWLTLVDNGEYAQSWQGAGQLFQSSTTQADWVKQVGPARKPLGKVMSRKLKAELQTRTLPGAPEGEYDIVRYDTVFANRQGAVETLILRRGSDGAWKVEGYLIK